MSNKPHDGEADGGDPLGGGGNIEKFEPAGPPASGEADGGSPLGGGEHVQDRPDHGAPVNDNGQPTPDPTLPQ